MSRNSRRRKRQAARVQAHLNATLHPVSDVGVRSIPGATIDPITKDPLDYELCILDAAFLERDYSYQRYPKESHINQIAEEFDPRVVNVVKVSLRDGKYYVVDGSHTVEVLRKLHGTEHFLVDCKLFHGLTYEQEAELFAKQQGLTHKVDIGYLVNAEAQAGDAETLNFLRVTREAGFEIIPKSKSAKKGRIVAIKAAVRLYENLGEAQYRSVLRMLMSAWEGEKWSVTQNMLSGMGILVQVYGELDLARFRKKLSTVTDIELQRTASKYVGYQTSVKYAMAIARFYNKGGGVNALNLKKMNYYA